MSAKAEKGAQPSQADPEIQVSTEDVNSVTRALAVTVPQARVQQAYEQTYRQLSRTASVRGFRKGKVPRSVLEKLYGASIPEEIERVLVQETIGQAIEKSGLEPLAQPEVEAGRPQADADFEYTLRIEVKPTIELPDLDGLPVKAPVVHVEPDEVEAELERLRQTNAPLIEEGEDVPVADGHTITFDYEGRVDGELFDGGKAEGVDLEIGSGRMIPGFEAGLLGARTGDRPTIEVQFPEDYQAQQLAGKDAEFACIVHAIRKRQVANLDDEFAKDLGEYETLDALRAKIMGDFMARRERERQNTIERSAMDALLERVAFDVPPGLVERQLEQQIHQMEHQFKGQIPPDLLNQQLARMREDGRDSAARRVRESFVLEALAKHAALAVTPGDVEERYREMAEAQGMEIGQLKQLADSQGWAEAVETELLDKKALAFLVSKATVEDIVEGGSEATEETSEDR